MHKFQDLDVYRRSLEFGSIVRSLIRQMPTEERGGLGDQMRRAADSITLNVAEGAGNPTGREFARFLTYAIRSGFECRACLDILNANGFITSTDEQRARRILEAILSMLYNLRRSVASRA